MTTKILIVDDSQIERLLIEGMLSKESQYRIQHASDGAKALKIIAKSPPDLVITDLIMPCIDGLELVRRLRNQYPNVPVILLTAFGDEGIAAEALEAGAASYVPKAQKAERLLPAVERVAAHAQANRSREELDHCMLEYHTRYALGNDIHLIRMLVNQLQHVMAGIGFGDFVERIRMGEAIEEAILNAMYHGNLEISEHELARVRAELDSHVLERLVEERCRDPRIADRRILVVAHLQPTEVRFVVRDEGRGFRQHMNGAKSTENIAAGQRRGMTLIRAMADEVSFNKNGNELVIRKRATPRAACLATAANNN